MQPSPREPIHGDRQLRRSVITRAARDGNIVTATLLARRHLAEFPEDAPMLNELGVAAARSGELAWRSFVTFIGDVIRDAVAQETAAA
jgi:hypothetical protein